MSTNGQTTFSTSTSQSYSGVGVIKIYFQPSVQIDLAISPSHSFVAVAFCAKCLQVFLPPQILKYDSLEAYPSFNLVSAVRGFLSHNSMISEQNFIRGQLATIEGGCRFRCYAVMAASRRRHHGDVGASRLAAGG